MIRPRPISNIILSQALPVRDAQMLHGQDRGKQKM